MRTNATREEWLEAATIKLQRSVFKPAGLTIPADVRVTTSWPGGRGSSNLKVIGECWMRAASAAHVPEVFISPVQDDSLAILAVLVHELIHAIDDCQNGHNATFGRMARAVGLEGKLTATTAGDALTVKLADIVARLGEFPHDKLTPSLSGKKKQTTRMLKLECLDCMAVWRMSRSHAVNATLCPCCMGTSITNPAMAEAEVGGDDSDDCPDDEVAGDRW